jgi:2-keto-3-deoxy-L-fuconate dehydrogenase
VQLLLNAAEFAHDATILKICEAKCDFSLNLNVKSMHRTIHAFLPTIRSPARVPSSTSPRSPPISCPEAFAAIAFALATSMLERAATASLHGRALFICRQRMGRLGSAEEIAALAGLASKRNPDAASTWAGSSTNDARSHLCTIFDRASERKID